MAEMIGPREIYKMIKGRRLSRRVSAVRRIDRVSPVPGRRVLAITFDDGPCVGPARPGQEPLTQGILKILKENGAKGTFNIIGTTEYKYPDKKGAGGGPYWNGVRYDHYPEFGQDHLAGAVNRPDLVKRMVQEGHELSNHGFSHAPFGPCRYPYAKRRFLPGFDAVLQDLTLLHVLVKDLTGYEMRLGRPAHYIDKAVDGTDAYDAYKFMDYLYLGASFDGGGWKASCGDFTKDVEDMVSPLRSFLSRFPDGLNGAIVFHKDGYNMSAQAPVLEGLARQMQILKEHEYDVVTVSQLLSMSRFSDLEPGNPLYNHAEAMLKAGYLVAFRDNCIRPEKKITLGELRLMCIPMGAQREKSSIFGPKRWATGYVPEMLSGNRYPSAAQERFQGVRVQDLADACRRFVREIVPENGDTPKRIAMLESALASLEKGQALATRADAIKFLSAAFVDMQG